jgi:hypothetical protein
VLYPALGWRRIGSPNFDAIDCHVDFYCLDTTVHEFCCSLDSSGRDDCSAHSLLFFFNRLVLLFPLCEAVRHKGLAFYIIEILVCLRQCKQEVRSFNDPSTLSREGAAMYRSNSRVDHKYHDNRL